MSAFPLSGAQANDHQHPSACAVDASTTRRVFMMRVASVTAGIACTAAALSATNARAQSGGADKAVPKKPATPATAVKPAAPSAAPASAAAAAPAAAVAPAMVSDKDPQALAMGYVVDTTKVDAKKYPKHAAAQKCSNCAMYSAKDGATAGACPIFAGKSVAASGWCSAYVKKA